VFSARRPLVRGPHRRPTPCASGCGGDTGGRVITVEASAPPDGDGDDRVVRDSEGEAVRGDHDAGLGEQCELLEKVWGS
jgi:hypothetical protein